MSDPAAAPRSSLRSAYRGRRVLITGHTGFKGAWLVSWLHSLGAKVAGYSLAPLTPSMFVDLGLEELCDHRIGDVSDADAFAKVVDDVRPEVVFHLAAQSLVRESYREPLETIRTNVLGTTVVLDTLRTRKQPCAVVMVSSDKCYENREWSHGYRENDRMGGRDPYSMSKGAMELVVASYRDSFFAPGRLDEHGIAVASARAGNVIGGGDWAVDRIVPDAMRALFEGRPISVRNPRSIRPWQHVLEPLAGYLSLGIHLLGLGSAPASSFCEGWNFGPRPHNSSSVEDLVEEILRNWGAGTWSSPPAAPQVHEAGILRLNIDKAMTRLAWEPRWSFAETIRQTVHWYRRSRELDARAGLRELTLQQVHEYMDGLA